MNFEKIGTFNLWIFGSNVDFHPSVEGWPRFLIWGVVKEIWKVFPSTKETFSTFMVKLVWSSMKIRSGATQRTSFWVRLRYRSSWEEKGRWVIFVRTYAWCHDTSLPGDLPHFHLALGLAICRWWARCSTVWQCPGVLYLGPSVGSISFWTAP